ncbi:hypothetical protein FIBSPDRAFT_291898 [Athelia psychrophila]|nr:hypothetical protein FIBSPDRAFT_291898 [Fibularhizoctonia sp. CBS 109695]
MLTEGILKFRRWRQFTKNSRDPCIVLYNRSSGRISSSEYLRSRVDWQGWSWLVGGNAYGMYVRVCYNLVDGAAQRGPLRSVYGRSSGRNLCPRRSQTIEGH